MTEITQNDAIQIVAKHLECSLSSLTVLSDMPANFRIYKVTKEPAWLVRVAPSELKLVSAHVVLVGKQSGIIHYDGSAGDER
ncbi:MAG: hypothetical protein PHV02_11995 [Rhodocyclaceae bacterium]|nr:hypothetical protein [Rhodocyclaceae bacterium]